MAVKVFIASQSVVLWVAGNCPASVSAHQAAETAAKGAALCPDGHSYQIAAKVQ